MLIYDAERFGLATLHQLRGRVGRNELQSTCILIGSKSNKRLKVLEESNDGFYITEKDYESGKTEMYSLADFSPRKSENIEKAYLLGRFGAIPFIKGE